MKSKELLNWCLRHSLPELIQPARLHPVDAWGEQVWIGREDENGFLGGTKKRKYASLLHSVLQHDIHSLRIIGGPYSNHVPALLSLAKQYGLSAELWLKASQSPNPRGTAWLSLLLNGEQPIRWLHPEQWPARDALAHEQLPAGWLVVPEGACCMAAWPGALSLAAHTVMEEEALGEPFEHIWVDAGTGLTAAALILGLGIMDRFPTVHVMLAAGNEESFSQHLGLQMQWAVLYKALPNPNGFAEKLNIRLHSPPTARAFGSVNSSVEAACKAIISETGILVDPIYTGKLIMSFLAWKKNNPNFGTTKIIHGGGTASLLGFSEKWKIV
jgi:1-aminocyclopropane-1-carboxylate deaminase/D-cysteine desulfhydrase-like pyridoxal-dependent ACC family enzyme